MMRTGVHSRYRLSAWMIVPLTAAILLLIPPGAWPQAQEPDRQMSVTEAVRTALADNHEILALKSSALAQAKDIGVSRSYLLPRVSFEERYIRTTNPTYAFMDKLNQERIAAPDFNPDSLNHPDAMGDYQTSFTIEQPVFVPKAIIGLGMSERESRAKDNELIRKREDIAYQTVKACLMIMSAKEYARASVQGVKDAAEHLRVTNLRYSNKLVQYSDTLRASTALMEARQRNNSADKNLALAKRGLSLLLSQNEPVDVSDTGLTIQVKAIEEYQDTAKSRSDIRAAMLRQENARKSISMAEAGYYPYLGVGGSYQLNDHKRPFGSEGDSWQAGAFLRWDLFDGTRREYERAKAVHQASQASEQLAAFMQGVSYRIHEAYLNVDEARKNSELAREALKTAEEGARLVRLRYENSLASLSDLLNVQTSLEQARAGLVEKENAERLAIAALSYESGTILRDLNIEGQ